MNLFHKKAKEEVPESTTYEEEESNPELLAAEAAVNKLPPPPPFMGDARQYFNGGVRPQIVDVGGEMLDEETPE